MSEPPRDFLEFLARSDNRVTVLATLATGRAFTQTELRTETGLPRSTVSRILDEFIDTGLVANGNSRYEVTPFGRFIAKRLHSIFDSIDAMQRLQTLLNELSTTEPDLAVTDFVSSELLTPTSVDPDAPARRFTDLFQAASRVRLLSPAATPVLFDVDAVVGEGVQPFDVVIPRAALDRGKDGSPPSQQLRDAIASGVVTLFVYDGDVPYFAGAIDGTAVVGLTDDAGAIQGYLETSDETVRSWVEATVEAYQRTAVHVSIEDLTV